MQTKVNTNERSVAAAGSTALTLDDIKRSCDKIRELRATDVPDVYVMTTAAFEMIRRELDIQEPQGFGMSQTMSALIGIPIEHYATLDEVHFRCAKLMESGKRVALVSQ